MAPSVASSVSSKRFDSSCLCATNEETSLKERLFFSRESERVIKPSSLDALFRTHFLRQDRDSNNTKEKTIHWLIGSREQRAQHCVPCFTHHKRFVDLSGKQDKTVTGEYFDPMVTGEFSGCLNFDCLICIGSVTTCTSGNDYELMIDTKNLFAFQSHVSYVRSFDLLKRPTIHCRIKYLFRRSNIPFINACHPSYSQPWGNQPHNQFCTRFFLLFTLVETRVGARHVCA